MFFSSLEETRLPLGNRVSKWTGVLLAAATLVIVLITFEIGVRVFGPQERGLFIADPYIRTIHRPNVETVKKTEEFTAAIKTNAQGFIGDDFVKEKSPGEFRIAAIGDSFTEGFQVNYDETFSARIGAYNFGMSGSGTTHQISAYEHYARQYDPDLVIWEFTIGNDFADDLLLGDNTRESRLRAILSNWFHSPRFVVRKLEEVRAAKELLLRWGVVSRDLKSYDVPDRYPFVYDIYNVGEDTAFERAFDTTCDLARRFRDTVAADGVPLVALILPTKEQVFDDDWNQLLERYPAMNEKTWDRERPTRVLARCFEDLDIEYLDFLTIFRDRSAAGSPRMYYLKDGHINAVGHAIIADELLSSGAMSEKRPQNGKAVAD